MSRIDKLLERIASKPSDFTWSELCTLFEALGYALKKASGSGRKFKDPVSGHSLFIHEPHPSSVLKQYQVRDAIDFLIERSSSVSQTLQHRGYRGSVLFSAEDRMFHGRILGIRDIVSYGGTDVPSLEHNFSDAVDEYLAFCAEEGKIPDVPYEGKLRVHVGSDLHKRAAIYAERHSLKLSAVVQRALKSYLSHAD